MARSVTPQERIDLKLAADAVAFVTDDNKLRLDLYNCLGFAFGLQHRIEIILSKDFQLTPEKAITVSAPALLSRWGFRERDSLSATEKGVALFNPYTAGWHVAKHLRDGWYESKCNDGLRIVHRLGDFTGEGYGPPVGFWEFDGTDVAVGKLKVALWEETGLALEAIPRVDDSAAVLDTMLLTHLIDRLRGTSP